MALKPITPLTDIQSKQVSDLQQQKAAIRQIMANATTVYNDAQSSYSKELDKFKAANDPALNIAKATYDNILAKCHIELSNIEDTKRAMRTVELI